MRVGEVAHRDLARGREVVGAGLAAPDDAGAQRGGDVVVMDELEGHAGVGEDADGAGQRAPAGRAGAPASAPASISAGASGPATMHGRKTHASVSPPLSASSRTSSTSALWAE